MTEQHFPWVEKYRPKKLSELTSDNSAINFTLQQFIKNDSMPHLLFYGPPGTGKTSTILALARQLYGKYMHYMVMELNVSDNRGIDVIRKTVKQFVSSSSMIDDTQYKLVILDEIDAQTLDAQHILKRIIEMYSKKTRFCLICNDKNKIIPALQSRCELFRFKPHKPTYIKTVLTNICAEEGLTNIPIDDVINICDGDMRKCINTMQGVSISCGEHMDVYVYSGHCRPDDIKKIYRLLLQEDFNLSYQTIKTMIYNNNMLFDNIITAIAEIVITDSNMHKQQICFIIDRLAVLQYNYSTCNNVDLFLSTFISIFMLSTTDNLSLTSKQLSYTNTI